MYINNYSYLFSAAVISSKRDNPISSAVFDRFINVSYRHRPPTSAAIGHIYLKVLETLSKKVCIFPGPGKTSNRIRP